MKLFVDDLKMPELFNLPKDTPHAKSGEEAIEMWRTGKYSTLYLDHDLGMSMNGLQVLLTISKMGPKPTAVVCISANPVGVVKIKTACQDLNIPYFRKSL